jgi:hypothetical protein
MERLMDLKFHLTNFLIGAGSVLVLWPGSSYRRPERGAASEAIRNIVRDTAIVADGMTKQVSAFRGQIDKG